MNYELRKDPASAKSFLCQSDIVHEFPGPVDRAGHRFHLFPFKEEPDPFHAGILAQRIHHAVADQGLRFFSLLLNLRPETFAQVDQQGIPFRRDPEDIILPDRRGKRRGDTVFLFRRVRPVHQGAHLCPQAVHGAPCHRAFTFAQDPVPLKVHRNAAHQERFHGGARHQSTQCSHSVEPFGLQFRDRLVAGSDANRRNARDKSRHRIGHGRGKTGQVCLSFRQQRFRVLPEGQRQHTGAVRQVSGDRFMDQQPLQVREMLSAGHAPADVAYSADQPRSQLLRRLGCPVDQRLALLQAHPSLLEDRYALMLAYVSLLNQSGQYEKALSLLMTYTFHVWEGGEGKVADEYKTALFALAERALAEGKAEEAIRYAERTLTYPDNLGEGKLDNVPDNRAYYLMGCGCRQLGDAARAEEYFRLAASGSPMPEPVRYYNDQPSDYIYWQGLAFHALGNDEMAKKSFHQLIAFGERHIFDVVGYDFFASSIMFLSSSTGKLSTQ